MSAPAEPVHEGPVHAVRSKRDLAEHVGEEHRGPAGQILRVVFPDARGRSRWTLEELERTHAGMHEGLATIENEAREGLPL